MSNTKFESAKSELISQVDINSERFTPKLSQCSCIDCDSIGCFSKRNTSNQDRCQCSLCREIRTCLTIPDKGSREDRTKLESATKKIIREVVTRETMESLKRVTETMYEYSNHENYVLLAEEQSKRSNKKDIIAAPTKSQISNIKECCRKSFINENSANDTKESCKQSITSQKDVRNKNEQYKESRISHSSINDKTECCKQIPIARVPSTDNQPVENNTASKLSAQVMNVPYEELNESVPSSHEVSQPNPLSKLNIFKRIKEIYEACSCKVCECISSKPRFTELTRDIRDDFCKCKPCECQDCVKTRKKIEEKRKRVPHSGCPCIRCDRKDCRGIAKDASESQGCDCNPSDTILYPEILSKSCKCEPCQCIKCRLSDTRVTKTVKLGQVDKIIDRETCNCDPCECIECKNIYSRTNPTIMYATAAAQHRYHCRCDNCSRERCQFGEIGNCQCASHDRTIRKPFENNYNDYDIRTVIIDNNGPFNKHKQYNFETQKTVALCSSLKSSYPSNSCKEGRCKCTECECIVCTAKEELSRSDRGRLRPNTMSVHNTIMLPTPIMNACKCIPCECAICSKKRECVEGVAIESNCRCEVCDCLNCDKPSVATLSFPSSSFTSHNINRNQHAKPIRSMDMNKNCDCNSCKCKNCRELFSCSSSVKFYSNGKSIERKSSRRVRKVMLVTPSTSQSRLKAQKSFVRNVSSTSLSSPKESIEGVFRQDLSTCHAISLNNHRSSTHFSKTSNNDQAYQIYENGKKYNFTTDNNIETDIFVNLNEPILESESSKSIDETTIMDSCDVPHVSFNSYKILNDIQHEQSEIKYESFNEIHESLDTIASDGSVQSFPVFWTCRNETAYPRSLPRNIIIPYKKTKSRLIGDLSKSLNNRQIAEKKPKLNTNEKSKKVEQANQKLHDEPRKSSPDTLTDHYEHSSYLSRNLSYCSDDDDDVGDDVGRCQKSYQKSNQESFSTSVNNSYLKHRTSITNQSDVNINYERATMVLGEAKAFSSKLIKLLDSFETANKQFESASQKFKVLHESLLDINEDELNTKHSKNLKIIPKPIFHDSFEIISEGHHDKVDDFRKNENEAEREYEGSTIKPIEKDDNFKEELIMPKNYNVSESKYINKTIVKTREIKSIQNEISSVLVSNSNIQEPNPKQISVNTTLNKFVEKSPYIELTPMQVSGSHNLNPNQDHFNEEPITEINKNITKIIQKHPLSSDMNKTDSVFGNTSVKVTDDKAKESVKLSKGIENQHWKIFNKNVYLNNCPVLKRNIFECSPLELDTKRAIQALQNANDVNYAKIVPRSNEALVNLQNEVNSLLNMPILQTSSQFKRNTDSGVHLCSKSKLDMNFKSLSSTTSQTNDQIAKVDKEVNFDTNARASDLSCDDLKARFIDLRRVSDHTVLVKWKVPKRLEDVQGYELLVDGRAVRQVLGPARGSALVSCLPRNARVLLTVRTLAARRTEHAPAVSVVYRPRK